MTAYERQMRRREVVRLKWGAGMNHQEVAEELGVSERTIDRDVKHLKSQLSKLDDPDFLGEQLRAATQQLLEHELDDLRRADREQDEKAKHRAKGSLRSTVKTIKEIEEDVGLDETEDEAGEFFDGLPEDIQEQISEEADGEVERFLEN